MDGFLRMECLASFLGSTPLCNKIRGLEPGNEAIGGDWSLGMRL